MDLRRGKYFRPESAILNSLRSRQASINVAHGWACQSPLVGLTIELMNDLLGQHGHSFDSALCRETPVSRPSLR